MDIFQCFKDHVFVWCLLFSVLVLCLEWYSHFSNTYWLPFFGLCFASTSVLVWQNFKMRHYSTAYMCVFLCLQVFLKSRGFILAKVGTQVASWKACVNISSTCWIQFTDSDTFLQLKFSVGRDPHCTPWRLFNSGSVCTKSWSLARFGEGVLLAETDRMTPWRWQLWFCGKTALYYNRHQFFFKERLNLQSVRRSQIYTNLARSLNCAIPSSFCCYSQMLAVFWILLALLNGHVAALYTVSGVIHATEQVLTLSNLTVWRGYVLTSSVKYIGTPVHHFCVNRTPKWLWQICSSWSQRRSVWHVTDTAVNDRFCLKHNLSQKEQQCRNSICTSSTALSMSALPLSLKPVTQVF